MTNSLHQQSSNRRSSLPFLVGGCIAVLGTFGGWIVLFLQPFLADQRSARQTLQQVAELRKQRPEILEKLTDYQKQAEHWKSLDAQRLQRCSANSGDAEFLEWVHRQADASELTIRDFRPGAKITRNCYEGRAISVSAQGSYRSVCKLLDSLRSCPQMFRVTGLDLTARDEDGNELTMNLQGLLLKAARPNVDPKQSEG